MNSLFRLLPVPPLLLGILPLVAGGQPGQQPSMAGTYHLAICKRQPCSPGDTANVVVDGVVVLSDTTYNVAAFPDTVRFSLMRGEWRSPKNGCSATASRRAAPNTFAAIGGMELISWTRDGSNRVSFSLHEAAGVTYAVALTLRGDELRGTGRSLGSRTEIPAYPEDIVIGRKVAADSHVPCSDSATVWLRKQQED